MLKQSFDDFYQQHVDNRSPDHGGGGRDVLVQWFDVHGGVPCTPVIVERHIGQFVETHPTRVPGRGLHRIGLVGDGDNFDPALFDMLPNR